MNSYSDLSLYSSLPVNSTPDEQNPMLNFARHEVVIRIFDIVIASTLFIILAPLMMCIAIFIRCSSKGRAIYTQSRATIGGKTFSILKFRTMIQDAEQQKRALNNEQKGGVIFKHKSDPRVTFIGKILRRTSLDELPQLWNVIKGDMSLVGPRPHPIHEVENYPSYAKERLDIKPGITGLAQVKGRSDLTFQETIEYDLDYMRHRSLLYNIQILFLTVKVVITGKGAY